MGRKILRFMPQLIIIILVSLESKMLLAFIWVSIHELAHLLISYKLSLEKEEIGIHPLGAYLKIRDLDYTSPNTDILISVSGPLSNLFFAIIFYSLFHFFEVDFFWLSFRSNIVLFVFNMLPAFPLDGARILRAYLSKKKLYKTAYKITVNCSFIIASILLSGFIFLLIFRVINLSLGIMAVSIFIWTYKEKERIMYIIMGDIVKKRSRFIKQKYIESKSISVSLELSLAEALGLIDKNKYNIFMLLDQEMRFLGTLYEEDIILSAKEYGNITLEELIGIEGFKSKLHRD